MTMYHSYPSYSLFNRQLYITPFSNIATPFASTDIETHSIQRQVHPIRLPSISCLNGNASFPAYNGNQEHYFNPLSWADYQIVIFNEYYGTTVPLSSAANPRFHRTIIDIRSDECVGRWRSFNDACRYVWPLGLPGRYEWRNFSKSKNRPLDIPSNPDRVYKHHGWKSWAHWLGISGSSSCMTRFARHSASDLLETAHKKSAIRSDIRKMEDVSALAPSTSLINNELSSANIVSGHEVVL